MSKKRKIVVIGGSILVLACICIGIFVTLSPDSEPESTQVSDEQSPESVDETNVAIESDSTNESNVEDKLSDTPSQPPTDVPPTSTPIPENTPIPTATPNPNLITPGTYMVGADIQPGLYQGETGVGFLDSCYWARLSDLSGNFDALLANDNSIGQFYVEVKEDDIAFETQCEMIFLSSLPDPTDMLPQNITPGTYLVGIDIQSGIYRGEAGTDTLESCYWARLSDVSGDFDGLLANDNGIGQFYFEVKENDFAIKTQCSLDLLSSLPEPTGEFPQSIMPGTYIIGRDIQAGTYRGETGTDILDACYWARLSNVSGDFNGLIANDNSNGQFFVQIQENDFALSTTCELELIEE